MGRFQITPLFQRRAGAYFVDLLVVFFLAMSSQLATIFLYGWARYGLEPQVMRAMIASPGARTFAQATHAMVFFSYFTLAHWYFGASVGKWVFGLRVVHRGGLSFPRALGRSLSYLLSGNILLGFGFFFPLFRKDGRTLHDLICDTDVQSTHSALLEYKQPQDEPEQNRAA